MFGLGNAILHCVPAGHLFWAYLEPLARAFALPKLHQRVVDDTRLRPKLCERKLHELDLVHGTL